LQLSQFFLIFDKTISIFNRLNVILNFIKYNMINRKVRVEFLIGNGFFALRIDNKFYGVVPVKAILEPVYVPVK